MEFQIEHQVPGSVEEVAEVLLDVDYQASLNGIGALSDRELLSQDTEEDGVVVRRVRCVLGVDPGPARRFLGRAEPAWVEEARWDPQAMRWGWVIHPEVAKSMLRAKGTIELIATDDGETTRRVTGSIKVNVPHYGPRVEAVIVDGLKSAYEDEAAQLTDWLEGG